MVQKIREQKKHMSPKVILTLSIIKVMAPIKRPMSRGYTSPDTKILSCWHCAHHDEFAAFVLHLWFRCFYGWRSHCFAPGTHQDQGCQNLALCSPWHSIMPQKTFCSIPCPSDVYLTFSGSKSPTNYGSGHRQNSQPCNFYHGIISIMDATGFQSR